MPVISRGFHGRHQDEPSDRVPPGQYVTGDFPVLSAGPTPHVHLDSWTFEIQRGGDLLASWTWDEFRALPRESVTQDIHCVTKWSKLDTTWEGVSVDTLLEGVDDDSAYVLAYSYGGYDTNLPRDDVSDGKAEAPYSSSPMAPALCT